MPRWIDQADREAASRRKSAWSARRVRPRLRGFSRCSAVRLLPSEGNGPFSSGIAIAEAADGSTHRSHRRRQLRDPRVATDINRGRQQPARYELDDRVGFAGTRVGALVPEPDHRSCEGVGFDLLLLVMDAPPPQSWRRGSCSTVAQLYRYDDRRAGGEQGSGCVRLVSRAFHADGVMRREPSSLTIQAAN